MRVATAYFVGAGTVVVAIAAGLGGGLLLGNIMSPQQPKYPSSEVTRLEQRASQQPIQAMNGASQPVPNLPAPQAAATVAAPPPRAEAQPAQQPQQQAAQPAEAKQTAETKSEPRADKAAPATVQPAAAAKPAPTRARRAGRRLPKARDADLKRDARRAEESRRKAERRQQWVEAAQVQAARRRRVGRRRGKRAADDGATLVLRPCGKSRASARARLFEDQSMIRKSVERFSEKIMLKQKVRAR